MIKSRPADRELDFIRDISSRDGMNVSTDDVYFRYGLGALAYVRLSLQAAGQDESRQEFPVTDLAELVTAYERNGFGCQRYIDSEADYGISPSPPLRSAESSSAVQIWSS